MDKWLTRFVESVKEKAGYTYILVVYLLEPEEFPRKDNNGVMRESL